MRLLEALPVDAVGFGSLTLFCLASFFTIWGATSRRRRAPFAMLLAFIGAFTSMALVAQPGLLEVAVLPAERGRFTGLTATLVVLPLVGAFTAIFLRAYFSKLMFNPSTLCAFAFAVTLSAILCGLFLLGQAENFRSITHLDDVLKRVALLFVFPILFAAFSLGYAAFEDETGDEDFELLAMWQSGVLMMAFVIVLVAQVVLLVTQFAPQLLDDGVADRLDARQFWQIMTWVGWVLAVLSVIYGMWIRGHQPHLHLREQNRHADDF